MLEIKNLTKKYSDFTETKSIISELEEITMKKLLALFTVISIAFTGCSIKKDKKTADEMPPDKPWNRIIMETDNGYYYQANLYKTPYNMSLRYSEKSNGTDIFLCAKPECQHNGETTCTATYPFMGVSNYVLYDGLIYFSADESNEEEYGYSFYKEALDGSSLDKVAEIRRVKNNSSNDDYFPGRVYSRAPADICIHKGYAYIPYSLGDSHTYNDFVETGFARVNILTGESEILFSYNDFLEAYDYSVQCGIGDYLYYTRSKGGKNTLCIHNIKSGETEEITGELSEAVGDSRAYYSIAAITEDTVYMHYYDGSVKDKESLTAYDINTFKKKDFELLLADQNNTGYHKTLFYDNKIFVVRLNSIDVYSNAGELLGSHPIPSYIEEGENITPYHYDFREFDISNDKIYMLFRGDSEKLDTVLKNDDYEKNNHPDYSMYGCSIEDVIAGKGDWEKQYAIIY